MLLKKIAISMLPILFTCLSYAQDGATLYKNTCESCHGVNMDGNGPIGAALNPKPSHLNIFNVAQLIEVMKFAKKIDGDKKDIPLMVGIKTQLKDDKERKAVAEYIFSKVGKKKK
jgi:mono/diheme cytochrome c family protein